MPSCESAVYNGPNYRGAATSNISFGFLEVTGLARAPVEREKWPGRALDRRASGQERLRGNYLSARRRQARDALDW
jgi:hypothetical protein